jgi:PAS domain-containing protein
MATPADVSITQFNPRLISTLQSFSRVASATTILVGGLVLVGWVFNIPTLISIVPGWSAMKVNTALAFVLAGAALWLVRTDQPKQRGASACALLVALIGFLTLTEYLFGWDLGIDQRLLREALGSAGSLAPGRMAPVTALNCLLLGIALLLLSWDRAHGLLQFLTLTAIILALLAVIGYVYGVTSLYRIPLYVSVALHTAATFLVLGVGLLCARPTRGAMRMVTRESVGGLLARRLLPAALLLPLILGWLRLAGQWTGLYDTEFGLSLFVLATVSVFTVLIWWTARSLDQMDMERQRATAAVHASEERTRATLDAALDGIITIEATGRVVEFNPAAEQIFGYRHADAMGRELADLIVPPTTRDAYRRGLAQCVATGEGALLGKRIELRPYARTGASSR